MYIWEISPEIGWRRRPVRKIIRERMCREFQEVPPAKDIVFALVKTRAVPYWSRHVRRHVL